MKNYVENQTSIKILLDKCSSLDSEIQSLHAEGQKDNEEYENKLKQIEELCLQLKSDNRQQATTLIRDLKASYDIIRVEAEIWKLKANELEKAVTGLQEENERLRSENKTFKKLVPNPEQLRKEELDSGLEESVNNKKKVLSVKGSDEQSWSQKIDTLEKCLKEAQEQIERLRGDKSNQLKEDESHCAKILNSAEKQCRIIEAWTEKVSQYGKSIKEFQHIVHPLQSESNVCPDDESEDLYSENDFQDELSMIDDTDQHLGYDNQKIRNLSSFLQNSSTNNGIVNHSKLSREIQALLHTDILKAKTLDLSLEKVKHTQLLHQLKISQQNLKKAERNIRLLKFQCDGLQRKLEQKEAELQSSLKINKERDAEDSHKIYESSKDIATLNCLIITLRDKVSLLEAENASLSSDLTPSCLNNSRATTIAHESTIISRNGDHLAQCLMKKRLADYEQTIKDKERQTLSLQNENKSLKQENKNYIKELEVLKEKLRYLMKETGSLMKTRNFQSIQNSKR